MNNDINLIELLTGDCTEEEILEFINCSKKPEIKGEQIRAIKKNEDEEEQVQR
jgi:hypothetical protein